MNNEVSNFFIMSHRRSGTHFLFENLNANFRLLKKEGWADYAKDYDIADAFKLHLTPQQIPIVFDLSIEEFIAEHTCVYLIRDLRDVLVSAWHYWKRGPTEEHLGVNISKLLKNKTFSQYIRGTNLIDLLAPVDCLWADSYYNPIKRWISFTKWADYINVIRFEDLKTNTNDVLEEFSQKFDVCKKIIHI